MLTLSKASEMSSAIIIVRLGGVLLLYPVIMVVLMENMAVSVQCSFQKYC